jgi:hypothetical protein
VIQADAAAFVSELHARWLERNPPDRPLPPDGSRDPAPADRGSIFISYASEDVRAAGRLYEALTKVGGDSVWLDKRRLEPGSRWEEEILASVRREIRLFVPVISRNTEGRAEGYIFKEWSEAVERARGIPPGGRKFIVPVVIDADYDGNPSRYRQVPEPFRALHWGRAPDGEPDEALLGALKDAIRDARRREGP